MNKIFRPLTFIHYSLFIITLFITTNTFSQNISAFVDYQQKLQVFDDGVFRQAEYMPVQSMLMGQSAVAYVDNKSEFKIFYQGQAMDIDYATDIDYIPTRDLVVFRINKVLRVFDRGDVVALTYYLSNYVPGDSLVGFYDDYARTLKVYYNGQVREIETNLFAPPNKMLAGSNTLLYINPSGYLKIFYHGRVTDLGSITPQQFATGRDIAAWIDDYTQYFKVFYKGDTAKVEIFAPTSFKCGDGIVAYVDNSGTFKILSNGTLTTIKSYAPDFYEVKDGLVFYLYNSIYYAFYRGQQIEIERSPVGDHQVSNEGMAYLDDLNRLRFFHDGKVETISSEPPVKFQLNGNVIWYLLGVNDNKIYYNGRVY